MKKSILILVIVVVAVYIGSWLVLSFQTKAKYDNFRKEINEYSVTVTQMDSKFEEYLSEIESKWTCKSDETNGAHSVALRGIGLTPTVKNLIYLMNFQMPEYSWILQERNKKATIFAIIKSELCFSKMETIHVSADRKTAVIIDKDRSVQVFRDEEKGMRVTLHFNIKNK